MNVVDVQYTVFVFNYIRIYINLEPIVCDLRRLQQMKRCNVKCELNLNWKKLVKLARFNATISKDNILQNQYFIDLPIWSRHRLYICTVTHTPCDQYISETHRGPTRPTLSPERATLLLQSEAHARVTVGLPVCTQRAVHQVKVSRTRLSLPIAVLWQVTWSRGSTAQDPRALQLNRDDDEVAMTFWKLFIYEGCNSRCTFRWWFLVFVCKCTLQLSQQTPWAHSAPAFKVQLLALQHGLVHS